MTQREIPYEAADLMIPAKIVNAGFKVGLQSPLEPSNLEWVLSYGHRVMTRASGFANEAVQSFGCSSSQTIHVKLQVTVCVIIFTINKKETQENNYFPLLFLNRLLIMKVLISTSLIAVEIKFGL